MTDVLIRKGNPDTDTYKRKTAVEMRKKKVISKQRREAGKRPFLHDLQKEPTLLTH